MGIQSHLQLKAGPKSVGHSRTCLLEFLNITKDRESTVSVLSVKSDNCNGIFFQVLVIICFSSYPCVLLKWVWFSSGVKYLWWVSVAIFLPSSHITYSYPLISFMAFYWTHFDILMDFPKQGTALQIRPHKHRGKQRTTSSSLSLHSC